MDQRKNSEYGKEAEMYMKRLKSMKTRKGCVMKKANELSVLCDIDVCVIIFEPGQAKPSVYPEKSEDVCRVIDKYLSKDPDVCSKTGPNLVKEAENAGCGDDVQVDRFSFAELVELVGSLEAKIEAVDGRGDLMKQSQNLAKIEDVQFKEEDVIGQNTLQYGDCFVDQCLNDPAGYQMLLTDGKNRGGLCSFSDNVGSQEVPKIEKAQSEESMMEYKPLNYLSYLVDKFSDDPEAAGYQNQTLLSDENSYGGFRSFDHNVGFPNGAMVKQEPQHSVSGLAPWENTLLAF